ncbi:uncharacterized protein LOC133527528 [Cydia pomonella]|uniref:uncharacterized protein LOC133527528 n=1 Tax=Cydia pomonella TaxID=82600 RepID=UPI002ADDD744|nr:uncharacterized protein LOC133527528 [Cydia pomonella]
MACLSFFPPIVLLPQSSLFKGVFRFFFSLFLNTLCNMAGFKILILFVVFQIVNSKPFKEIHMKKDFEFSIKPPVLPIKPFKFIKHKWLHLGHGIVKRSPFELIPNPEGNINNPDSLLKLSLEKEFGIGTPLPPPPPPPPEGIPPAPLFIPEAPGISSPAPASVPPPVTGSTILVSEEYLSRLPEEGAEIIVITPVPPPPPPPVVSMPAVVPSPPPLPPPIPEPIPGPPPPLPPVPPEVPKDLIQGNLLTDIGRVEEINAYLKAVEGLGISPPPGLIMSSPAGPPPPPPLEAVLPVLNSNSIEVEVPKPPPPPPAEKTSPLVKGSRLALYFGNIFLQVMSEVLSSARSALSQYSPPAPI